MMIHGTTSWRGSPYFYQLLHTSRKFCRVPRVRILYFGSRRWACKIDSQKSNTLSVDWRVEPTLAQKLMSTFEVPDVLDCMCRALLESLELKVGAFDLIKTEYGWVFLEVNSTPSWNWMNPFVEDKIQKGIALELAQLELAQEAG